MIRVMLRAGALFTLGLMLVSSGFAGSPAKSKAKKRSKTTDNITASAEPKAGEAGTVTATDATPGASATAAAPAQGAGGTGSTDQPAPKFLPMLATTGTLGLFTTETADTLPKRAFAFSAYVNKFSRMPGSATLLNLGLDFSIGVTDRLTIYGKFEPYRHSHLGNNSQLSLAPPNNGFPLFPGQLVYHRVGSFTGVPGYIEDFPFVAANDGGVGEVTLGLKFGLLSERRGAPVSLSVRNDFIIPTLRNLSGLLDNGTQSGQFNDTISMALSKQWSNVLTATFNAGYRITRDPRQNGQVLFTSADQLLAGAGMIMFPESRFQPMMEYTSVTFVGDHTPDFTAGARDPVDGVWGFRLYLLRNLALDAGYRYMLNLKDANDRHGFVVKLGTTYWPEKPPPPPNRSPVASCSSDKSMVFVESGDTATITATASDPDSDPLTYTWSTSGGRIDGSGPQVRWLSAGTAVGSYTVTLRVDDGRGGTASCSADIGVAARPNRQPTLSCSADRTSIFAGERVHITGVANDPDGDQLTYTWRANAGQIVGSGAAVDWDSTGTAPGNYTITGRVDDGKGGAADCSTTVEVKAVPPPPQASKINECAFGRALSTRIDNVCKRILDDVALRLQNEPRATAVIIGYSDPKERNPDKVAGDRGTNAVKYLGEKGIDASRVKTRTGSGQTGATNNRRIDVIWVPEGATY